MEFSRQTLTLDEAKEIDLVDFLKSLGYEPSKIRSNDYWYLSPLRTEKTASFKVNQKLNRWYDHGIGCGGNLIDFGIRYFGCTVGELLVQLRTGSASPLHTKEADLAPNSHGHIRVMHEKNITSNSLIKYLQERRIAIAIARRYCTEITYELYERTYFAIGFKNDAGGYEIRNPYFKASASPKDIRILQNGASEVLVFEGFMDFLSFMTMHPDLAENKYDFVVLNSLSFFERSKPFLETHKKIRLYLDNDEAGKKSTSAATAADSRYVDESSLYGRHKDLNDWAQHFGKLPKWL